VSERERLVRKALADHDAAQAEHGYATFLPGPGLVVDVVRALLTEIDRLRAAIPTAHSKGEREESADA
jgi:hypothetical protein